MQIRVSAYPHPRMPCKCDLQTVRRLPAPSDPHVFECTLQGTRPGLNLGSEPLRGSFPSPSRQAGRQSASQPQQPASQAAKPASQPASPPASSQRARQPASIQPARPSIAAQCIDVLHGKTPGYAIKRLACPMDHYQAQNKKSIACQHESVPVHTSYFA